MGGCQHFQNGVEVRLRCCGAWYACHRCHNEKGVCKTEAVAAADVDAVRCLACGAQQTTFGRACERCYKQLADVFFCRDCKIWEDRRRRIFHCNGCGVCRMGDERKFFHCDSCDTCWTSSIQNSHICCQNRLDDYCFMCLDPLAKSPTAVVGSPVCRHAFHLPCFRALYKSKPVEELTCPICNVTIV